MLNAQQFADNIRTQGGDSVRVPSNRRPRAGFMVAVHGTGGVVPGRPSAESIAGYVGQHSAELSKSGVYLGAWEHEGNTYVERAKRKMGRDDAMRYGRRQGQIAVWDASRGRELMPFTPPAKSVGPGTVLHGLPRRERTTFLRSNAETAAKLKQRQLDRRGRGQRRSGGSRVLQPDLFG